MGVYVIDKRNPSSQYYLSSGIRYANASDLAFAKAIGVPPGGDIIFPGTLLGKLHGPDGPAGCTAVSNCEIEEIHVAFRKGVPVVITPRGRPGLAAVRIGQRLQQPARCRPPGAGVA